MNTDRTQYVRSSSGLITIVVMTLFRICFHILLLLLVNLVLIYLCHSTLWQSFFNRHSPAVLRYHTTNLVICVINSLCNMSSITWSLIFFCGCIYVLCRSVSVTFYCENQSVLFWHLCVPFLCNLLFVNENVPPNCWLLSLLRPDGAK